MRPYNGFSGEQREEYGRLLKLEIKKGTIPPPRKCQRCGQTEGIMQYHTEDYTLPVRKEVLEPICWRCHMVHHSTHRAPAACARYWKQIAEGVKFKPAYRHDFKILKDQHGIA